MATTNQASERAVRDGLAEFELAGILREVDVPLRKVWVRAMAEIPAAIVIESTVRIIKQAGRRYPLTLPEWIGVCADIVDERRAEAAKRVTASYPVCAACDERHCEHCHGTGLRDVEGHKNVVEKCPCKARERELIEAAGQPLARPALPAHEPEPAA